MVLALRYKAVPITSNASASEPSKEMVLLPMASSLMVISATLIALLVEVFSGREVVVLTSVTDVGASFRSLIARL